MKAQRIGILGTGNVGRTLGKGLLDLGHEVCLGSRTQGNEVAVKWAAEAGPRASAGTFADAASFGEILFIATRGSGTEDAVRAAGLENFGDKIVLDTTNPLDLTGGKLNGLFVGTTDSLAEKIQRLVPTARIVKGFNSVGWPLFINPDFKDGTPDMFLCGADAAAKKWVAGLCASWGWHPVDLGDLEQARWVEALVMPWLLCWRQNNMTARHAYKFLVK